MKRFNLSYIILLLLIATFSVNAQEEMITNNEVISLSSANLNSSVIINKILTSKTSFDLSTDALIKLKKAGISDEIIHAMLEAKSDKSLKAISANAEIKKTDPNDPNSPHDFGIYLYEETASERKMTQLAPNVSDRNRSVGKFTSKLVPFGFGVVKLKAELDGTAADIQVQNAKPVFYFYLDAKSGGLNTFGGVPSTTTEFALVKFGIHDGNRQITISRKNAYKEKGGVIDENAIQFTTEDLGNGTFKVMPGVNLKPGEYGFFLINSGASNTSTAVGTKFFDFGVKLP